MAKCPKCGKEITSLENKQSGCKYWNFFINKHRNPDYTPCDDDFKPDDNVNEWICQECWEVVATSEEDAIKILKPQNATGSDVRGVKPPLTDCFRCGDKAVCFLDENTPVCEYCYDDLLYEAKCDVYPEEEEARNNKKYEEAASLGEYKGCTPNWWLNE